ncbi:MAG: hydrogenase maturation nickel metallochaperone HypA [Nevskia sp.]
MHELSVTRNVVAIVAEHAKGQRVTRVRLEIGLLSAILPDAVRFCFDLCAENTPAAGALLEIIEVPGRGRCDDCRAEVELKALVGRCPGCGGSRLQLIAGQEMKIREIELTEVLEPCA